MPKKAKELSGLVVSRLKSEGMYAVGGVDGLYLRIRNQSRAWFFAWLWEPESTISVEQFQDV